MLYWRSNGLSLYQGDSLAVLRQMPSESVQMVVTSPPFYRQRDYGVAGQIGLEDTLAQYLGRLVAIFAEVRRVLRKDGICFVEMGDSYSGGGHGPGGKGDEHSQRMGSENFRIKTMAPKQLLGVPWRLAFAMQDDGWILRRDIIWHKVNCLPESVQDRPTASHTYIFLFAKSQRYFWDAFAVRESSNTAGTTNLTSFGGSALTPESDTALDANDCATDCRGQLNLRQTENSIIGTVALKTKYFEIIKSIGISIVSEGSKGDFVIDLQPLYVSASLALITSTLQRLSANNTPVRATVIDATALERGATFAHAVDTIPLPDAFFRTESMPEPYALLTRIANEHRTAIITLDYGGAGEPLLISGILRPSHMPHSTINTRNNQGRNCRDVWAIPTEPLPTIVGIDHFAAYPTELARRCIAAGTSEKGCCPVCHKPWMRMVEEVPPPVCTRAPKRPGLASNDSAAAGIRAKHDNWNGPELAAWKAAHPAAIDWHPQCSHDADPIPCTVLDPFSGAGTTMLAANRLDRHGVGIELSPKSCKMTVARLIGDAPLLYAAEEAMK